MAATVIDDSNPTILDHINRQAPDGTIDRVVEALAQRNPILKDATMMEGNLPTGHRVTIRSGLPAIGYRLFNQGTSASKSTTTQVDEATSMLDGRSEVDVDLAALNGNEAAFRSSEDKSFIMQMNNTQADSMFYASTATDPEKFHGLAPRFDAHTNNNNSENVIEAFAGPSGVEQSSMWMVTWHPDTCFLIFPKGAKAGLTMLDLGIDYVDDNATPAQKYLAYRTHFKWKMGLVVKDWRYVVRICNIDETDVIAAPTGKQLLNALIKAYARIYSHDVGRQVIYTSRFVVEQLDIQNMNSTSLYLTTADWHGKPVTAFRGIPIIPCDALKKTEAVVPA